MNEWKKKCVGLQRTWVRKRTVIKQNICHALWVWENTWLFPRWADVPGRIFVIEIILPKPSGAEEKVDNVDDKETRSQVSLVNPLVWCNCRCIMWHGFTLWWSTIQFHRFVQPPSVCKPLVIWSMGILQCDPSKQSSCHNDQYQLIQAALLVKIVWINTGFFVEAFNE